MLTHTEGAASEPMLFCFKGMNIRAVAISGKVWFAAHDVAAILGTTVNQLLQGLEDTEVDSFVFGRVASTGKPVINECGLVRSAMHSKKAIGQDFSSWLLNEFLPNMHKVVQKDRNTSMVMLASQIALLRLHVSSLTARVVEVEQQNRMLSQRVAPQVAQRQLAPQHAHSNVFNINRDHEK